MIALVTSIQYQFISGIALSECSDVCQRLCNAVSISALYDLLKLNYAFMI
jgi:hypothetical protein